MLILASASPRRHELLLAAGLEHFVRVAPIREERYRGESAVEFVQRMAEEKARASGVNSGEIVLGADTVVCLDDEVFGKPENDEHAQRMLAQLSGRDHWVFTGVCLIAGERLIRDCGATKVSFTRLSRDEIQEYTRSGEHREKAGGYAIQGRAAKFVSSIQGCYYNVVGLPVALVYGHLKSL